MSYDLVVFEPREELRERSTFLNWYDSRTDWKDTLDYSDLSIPPLACRRGTGR